MDAAWSFNGEADLPGTEAGWGNFYADGVTESPSQQALADNLHTSKQIWHEGNVEIVRYQPAPAHPSCADQDLMRKFPRPDVIFQTFFPAAETCHPLSCDNYQTKFKDLLFAEENAQQQYIHCYNHGGSSRRLQSGEASGRAEIFFSSVLNIEGSDQTGSKPPQSHVAGDGELFGTVRVFMPIKPDTPWGRLMGRDVTSAFLASNAAPTSVFEVRVVHREELSITLLCPTAFVTHFGLFSSKTRVFYVQFLLDRVIHVQQLESIDRQIPSNVARLFPSPEIIERFRHMLQNSYETNIDSLPMPQMKQQLNPLQRIAIRTFLGLDLLEELERKCLYTPPLLVVGPFGTGKTHTLAECVRQLLYADDRRSTDAYNKPPANLINRDKMLNHERPTRVLVCTNSNSAADLYMLNFLPDIEQICAYRVYALTRFMTRQIMRYAQYTNRNPDPIGEAGFVVPTYRDLDDRRVVITTLNATSLLCHPTSDLPDGFFTHIIIDEAAQITEPTCIMPLRLATGATKILLAGDPLQSNPRVYSEFCIENELNRSLLERLFNMYKKSNLDAETLSSQSRRNSVESSLICFSDDEPASPNKKHGGRKRTNKKSKELIQQQQQCPFTVVLSSNYRSHRDICRLMSELFYTQYYGRAVVAANEQVLQHPVCPPLMFISCDDSADVLTNGSYYNSREVEVVSNMVQKIIADWPEGEDAWGPIQNEQIAVVTPYMEQVKAIRNVLRHRGLPDVTVESVNNVQGRQFRAIVMSCVRTQATLKYTPYELLNEETTDLGYLSDLKMVNTVITRAQSLVCVVGSAVDLLAYGRCRKMWHKFLQLCVDPEYYTDYKYARDKSAAAIIREKLKRKIQWNLKAPEFQPESLSESVSKQSDANKLERARVMDLIKSRALGNDAAAVSGEGAGKPLMPGEELLSTSAATSSLLTPPNSGGIAGTTPPPYTVLKRAGDSAAVEQNSAGQSTAYVPQVFRDKAIYYLSHSERDGFSNFYFNGQLSSFPAAIHSTTTSTNANEQQQRRPPLIQPYSPIASYGGRLQNVPMSPIFGARPAPVPILNNGLANTIAASAYMRPPPAAATAAVQPPPPPPPVARPYLMPPSTTAQAVFAPQFPPGVSPEQWSYFYQYIIAYMQAANNQQQPPAVTQQQPQLHAHHQPPPTSSQYQQIAAEAARAYVNSTAARYRPPLQLPYGPHGLLPLPLMNAAGGALLNCSGNPYALHGLMQAANVGSSVGAPDRALAMQQLQAALVVSRNLPGFSAPANEAASTATAPAVEYTNVVFHSIGKVSFTGVAAGLVRQNFDCDAVKSTIFNNQQQNNTAECLCSYCGVPMKFQNVASHLEKAHKSEFAVMKAVKHPPMLFFGYIDHVSSSAHVSVRPSVPNVSSAAVAGSAVPAASPVVVPAVVPAAAAAGDCQVNVQPESLLQQAQREAVEYAQRNNPGRKAANQEVASNSVVSNQPVASSSNSNNPNNAGAPPRKQKGNMPAPMPTQQQQPNLPRPQPPPAPPRPSPSSQAAQKAGSVVQPPRQFPPPPPPPPSSSAAKSFASVAAKKQQPNNRKKG